jgi:hypothetical protein
MDFKVLSETAGLSAGAVDKWGPLSRTSQVVAVEKLFGVKFQVSEAGATTNGSEFAGLIAKRLSEC